MKNEERMIQIRARFQQIARIEFSVDPYNLFLSRSARACAWPWNSAFKVIYKVQGFDGLPWNLTRRFPRQQANKLCEGISVLSNWSSAMAFVVKRTGKSLIIKIDSKIAKQATGIRKKPHMVLKINALWLIWCSSLDSAVEFHTR